MRVEPIGTQIVRPIPYNSFTSTRIVRRINPDIEKRSTNDIVTLSSAAQKYRTTGRTTDASLNDVILNSLPSLLPAQSKKPSSLADLIDSSIIKSNNRINDILSYKYKAETTLMQLKLTNMIQGTKNEYDDSRYLQYGNNRISSLTHSIVRPGDSDDEKAYKILMWVEKNLKYQSDIKTYGENEYWALPTLTLNKEVGDCEDGAFLIASLMLNAGVDPDRIRVYGGFVSAGTNASTGGHAWAAYKRETDDEWVPLDWCYFFENTKIADRETLAKNLKYIDDWFYITASETVDTAYFNSMRNIIGQTALKIKNDYKLLNNLLIVAAKEPWNPVHVDLMEKLVNGSVIYNQKSKEYSTLNSSAQNIDIRQ